MTDAQQEARDERTAICEADHVPQEEIQKIFRAYPWLFGAVEDKSIQGDIFK